jgi:molybdopterin synthase catalytic subunit
MRRQITILSEPINEANLNSTRTLSSDMGAVVCFLGIVRGTEAGQDIRALEYEAFERMAHHQFNRLLDDLEKRWPIIESIRLVHRIGLINVGEPSLWVEVVTPHRQEAFAATQWLIDEMKQVVPIWKKPVKRETQNVGEQT